MDGQGQREDNGPSSNPLLERINGVWATRELQSQFQHEVAQLLQRSGNTSFPGAQPVSFSAEHIQELKTQDYYVCEKTDGLRYLMYLTHDEQGGGICYLIDRRNDYWFIPHLHFPHHEDKTFNRPHTDTILDGELVEDRYENGSSVIKFLVFDCLVLDKQILMQRPLDKRLAYFKSQVLTPYQEMFKKQPGRPQPFVLEDKETNFSYGIKLMFEEIIPKVRKLHGNDGLIFTCRNTPYKTGTDPHILKWKPPNENTVDFLLHMEWPLMEPDPDDPDRSPQPDYYAMPNRFELYIHHGSHKYSYVDELYVESREWENWKTMNVPLQDIIVEAFQDEQQRWRYYRFRNDKDQSNHIRVYEAVIRSIKSHVTEQDLLDNANDIRSAWKARDEARRNPSNAR